MPNKDKVFFFDSNYHFKVFIDLDDTKDNLVRTDSAYYNEYVELAANAELIEILPGEIKLLQFGVPNNVVSAKSWVSNE